MHTHFTPNAATRFWSKVDTSAGPDCCWLWQGCAQKGYGVFHDAYKNHRAHRVAYELTYGAVLPGMVVCHRCDNPSCCNPTHLWIGTNAENSADMVAKGRSLKGIDLVPPEHRPRGDRNWTRRNPELLKRGSAHQNAKLDEEAVRQIRARYANGESQTAISISFGVSQVTISRIVRRSGWKHVT